MISSLKEIVQPLLRKQPNSGAQRFFVSALVKLFLLHCSSLALGFLLNFLLVKVVDLNVYGHYVYLFNLLNLLVNFCLFGMDTLLVRMAPAYEAHGELKKLKGVYVISVCTAGIGTVVFSICATPFIYFTTGFEHIRPAVLFLFVLLALLLLTLISVNQASLQALKKVVWSQLPDKILRPLVLIVIFIFLWLRGEKLSLQPLLWLNLATIGIACFVSFFFMAARVRSKLQRIKAEYDVRGWITAASAFFFMNLLYAVNSRVDVFMLGAFQGAEAVGTYNIVVKLSELISFVLSIVNFIIAPLAAGLYKEGKQEQLQQLITRAAQVIFVLSIPIVILFIVFRVPLLLLFGSSFLIGQNAFVVLCLGQLLNILSGSVGTLLLMSGNQKFALLSLAAGLLLHVVLNLLLTPRYAVMGTAIAAAASLALSNLLMYYFVRTRMHLRTTAFAVA